ncbi:MAG TPA: hypothetical protein VD788_12360 [Candidatus Polarisedimenticolaceae bacterium]|nr:hypothetical protein [Candidatus Polarisedimenticolaceae bacterium]
MVVLLVLSMILLFLTADYLVQRSHLRRLAREATVASPSLAGPADTERVPDEVCLTPGHVWMRRDPTGSVRVGVDPVLISLLGGVEHAYTVEPGHELAAGGPLVMLRRGSRALRIRSPLAGRVAEVNERLVTTPGQLASDPYRDGWLYRIEPSSSSDSLRGGLAGETARRFLERERVRLRDLLEALTSRPEQAVAHAADGGLPAGDAVDHLDDRQWERLIATFFHDDSRHEGTLVAFRAPRDTAGV